MSYSDRELTRLGWDDKKIKSGRQICANCGKEKMLHSVAGGCPLPKKGIQQNYSQKQVFTEVKP